MSERHALPVSERVPSHAVTAAMLEAWGFPVERREHIVGCGFIEHKGMTFGRALFEAWGAGFVRIESRPMHVREAEIAAFHARNAGFAEAVHRNLEILRRPTALSPEGNVVQGRVGATV